MDAPSPYAALLEAGDRLARALTAGDLDAVAEALDARGALLDAVASAGLSAPAPALRERGRLQDEQIRAALRDRLAVARDAVEAVGRAASVHDRYHAVGAPAGHRLDTARRGPEFF